MQIVDKWIKVKCFQFFVINDRLGFVFKYFNIRRKFFEPVLCCAITNCILSKCLVNIFNSQCRFSIDFEFVYR